MQPEVTLAPATADDLPYLLAIMDVTIRPWVEATFESWSQDMATESMSDDLTHDRVSMILVDGVRAGLLSLRDEPDRFHLEKIYVDPAFQRRGIGSQLLQELTARARTEGRPLTLRVLKVNPARRLYERHGFAIEETTPEYYLMGLR